MTTEKNNAAVAVSSPYVKKRSWKDFTTYIALALLIFIGVVLNKTFILPTNIMNILVQVSVPGLLAIGLNYAILTGGIDLSVGSLLAFGSCLSAMLLPVIGWFPAVLVTLIAGCVAGAVHGIFITKLGVPPFIATLAGQMIYRGAALSITGASAVPINNETFTKLMGNFSIPALAVYIILAVVAVFIIYGAVRKFKSMQKVGGLIVSLLLLIVVATLAIWLMLSTRGMNVQIAIFGIVFIAFLIVLSKTTFGRQIYAVGGNAEASRLAGIKVDRVLIKVYMISGALAIAGGILTTARLSSGVPQSGLMYETDAIAAVVLGGTSMTGGRGKVQGTLVGVLLIGILNNVLSLENVSSDVQMIFKGLMVLLAVVLDQSLSRPKR